MGIIGLLAMAPGASATTVTPACTGIQTDVDSVGAGDVIQLPAGTCSVNLTVNSDTAPFIIQGDPAGSTLTPKVAGTPILFSNAAVRFTVTGVTFSGASSSAAMLLENPGEAVTITHDTFTGNTYSSGFGAAISVQTQGNPGTPTTQPTVISNNAFDNNSASSAGAVAVLGANPMTISGNTFTGNTAGGEGGAILISGTATPNTSPVLITGNTFGGTSLALGNTSAGDGGAVALIPGQGQPMALTGNTFQSNRVTGSAFADREGGAVWVYGASNPAMSVVQSGNVFTSNVVDATQATPTPARVAGGGAEFVLAGSIASSRDAFAGNRVDTHDGIEPWGGAIGAFAASGTNPLPGVFVGTDDLFTGNSTAVGGWGGAIYVGGPPAACTSNCPASTLTLNDSTVVGNRVDAGAGSEGGAIWGSPQDHLTIRNSIVFGNAPTAEIFGFGTGSPSIQYSDVCAGAGGPGAPASAHNICADPKLDASGQESAFSPTLDAGSNALVPAGTTVDLAGNPRIRESRSACFTTPPAVVDMGAFEFTGHQPPLPCPAPISSVLIGAGPLRVVHGRTSVTLTCQGIGTFCHGTVTLSTVKRFRARDARARKRKPKPKPKPRQLSLGSARFSMNLGRRVTATIMLSRSGLAKLGKAATIRVLITAHNQSSNGAIGVTTTRTVTLVLRPQKHLRR